VSAQTTLIPGAGRRILGGGAFTATFEVVVPPGYDIGAQLLRADAPPDPGVVAGLRRRYDIDQITALHDGR
jgi:hypothetical protein